MLRPECGRRPIQKSPIQSPIEKARSRFPRRGLNSWAQFLGSILRLNSCDDHNVPVICPACQFSRDEGFVARWRRLFKPLNRRHLVVRRWLVRFGSGGRWRTGAACSLYLGRHARLCCSLDPRTPRGMPQSPGMRDRRPGGIADNRAGHRTDRSQHNRAGYRAQRRVPRALLGLCFERNKQAYDQRSNQKILHGAFPAQYASAKDSENTATPR
jgi:hypothetical protein